MPKVRPGAAEKWARRTASATEEYTNGIQSPRVDWVTATAAAAQNHTKATQQALADGRFLKGVQAAGSARWQSKALGKGAARFAPGVTDGTADYQRGVQPFLDVISNIVLPPRGPKGDPANFARVVTMANALRAKKLGK